MTNRPHQLRTAISGALDSALSSRTEPWARQASHRAEFEAVWTRLRCPNDPALKRRIFSQLAPDFAAWDARDSLRRSLAADASERRREAAKALERRRAQALALQQHQRAQALTAALDRRIRAASALERQRRLTAPGPIRLCL